MTHNRIAHLHPDYIFSIVRRPADWTPTRINDVPPEEEVLSQHYVASFEEALEDLVRCNGLSLKHGLKTWAVVHSPGGNL